MEPKQKWYRQSYLLCEIEMWVCRMDMEMQWGTGRVGRVGRVGLTHIRCHTCNSWGCVALELRSALCDELEGRDEGVRWEEGSRGRDTGTHTADSLCCTVAAKTTLSSNYTPIKIN